MVALKGYYDGNAIQTLERIDARKNQKVIITILDEFIEEKSGDETGGTSRGVLSKYANPALRELEKSAWEEAVVKKYGNA